MNCLALRGVTREMRCYGMGCKRSSMWTAMCLSTSWEPWKSMCCYLAKCSGRYSSRDS